MPRFYSVLHKEPPGADFAIDTVVYEGGRTCEACGATERPTLSVILDSVTLDGDETCLCLPCITRIFEEADGYFGAFPEKRHA